MIDFHDYFEDLCRRNRMASTLQFCTVSCSGVNHLDSVLNRYDCDANFVAVDDICDEETFLDSGGWFKRKAFTVFCSCDTNTTTNETDEKRWERVVNSSDNFNPAPQRRAEIPQRGTICADEQHSFTRDGRDLSQRLHRALLHVLCRRAGRHFFQPHRVE